MKKFLFLFGITFLMFGLAFNAHATSFDFLGSDEGGTASARVDFAGSGSNAFTITIDNRSPTSLNDGTPWANAPAITGVGFNIDPDVGFSDWSLTAYDINGNTKNITTDWGLYLNSGTGSIELDLYAAIQDVKGGLYNPKTLNASDPSTILAAAPQYFTKAVLTINFAEATTLVVDEESPFTLWKNVGLNGEGSLKLTGTPSIPDPAAVFLLGSACIIGFAGARRRLKK